MALTSRDKFNLPVPNWRQRLSLAKRRTKRTIEWFAYLVLDRLALFGQKARSRGETHVLLNLQLIGDFFLWLPFAQCHIQHIQSLGGKTVLVLNSQLYEVAQSQFPNVEIISIDPTRFLSSFSYRANALKGLRAIGAAEATCYAHPRDRLVHDACIEAIATKAIGFSAMYADRPYLDRLFSAMSYHKLIGGSGSDGHRLNDFSALLTQLRIRRPINAAHAVNPQDLWIQPLLPTEPYVVMAPGASQPDKQWPRQRFAEVARRTLQHFPTLQVVLVGAPSEAEFIANLATEIGQGCLSLAGRNSLGQLCGTIQRAKAVLCNDSAAAHIAAVLGTPSLVLMNGATFGHCLPYPKGFDPCYLPPELVFEPMPCFGCDRNCRFERAPQSVFPCLDALSTNKAWERFSELLTRLGAN